MMRAVIAAALFALSIISGAAAQDAVVSPGGVSYGPTVAVPIQIPTGLGWDQTNFPLSISLFDVPGLNRTYATASFTPESLFDAWSTARASPGKTYFVSTSGSDSNNCLSSGAACLTMNHAVTLANAGAVTAKINVASGTYVRTSTPGFGALSPTVDIAWVATGGRVIVGTFDAYSAPSRDGTSPLCYSFTLTSVDKVVNLTVLNQYGNYSEFVNPASPTTSAQMCAAPQDAWLLEGGKIYINRADQAVVTNANTRVYRSSQSVFYSRNQTNTYIGGATGNDGFDAEGGNATGVLDFLLTAPTTTNKVLVIKNSSFKYGGGAVGTATRGISVDSFQGLVFLSNVRADANATDGINRHNTNSATNPLLLSINSTGYDNGRLSAQSDNCWTTHDTVIGISAGDYCWNNRGGSYRSINTSLSLIAGGFVRGDLGDLANTGSIAPTAFSVGNTATYWVDHTKVDMPAGTYGYVTETSGGTINLRNPWPTALPNSGPGTFTNYLRVANDNRRRRRPLKRMAA